ncbi:MAG: lysophospholipid acyltransferase family protein [Cyanobacteria bacterium J06632_3]
MHASQPTHIFSLLPALQAATRIAARASQTASKGELLDGWSLEARDPAVLEQMMPLMRWFYNYYYRVSSDGWEHIPTDEHVMFVGSHNGGLAAPDMHMMLFEWCDRFTTARPLYGLMSPKVWQAFPALAHIATQMGAVRAHPKMGIAALNRSANVAVYPGGAQDVFRPYAMRNQIYFHNRKGFIKLALKKAVPIVPMISYGAHSTFIVLADIYPQMQALHNLGMPWILDIDPETFPIYLGLPWGIAAGPVPHIPPPLKLHTRICPPIRFERTGPAALRDNDYVNACFHQVKRQMQASLDDLVAECESQ